MADLFSGLGQQTLAVQLAIQKAAGSRGGRKSAKRRRKAAGAKKKAGGTRGRGTARRGRRMRGKGKRPARLVKGSPAARRHMARLRRMRRRKR